MVLREGMLVPFETYHISPKPTDELRSNGQAIGRDTVVGIETNVAMRRLSACISLVDVLVDDLILV
jgi:hypothetical protein